MVFGKVDQKFDEVAAEFDETMQKLIPHYHQLLDSLVEALPYQPNDSFRIIDLGCGTGCIGQRVLRRFPNARLTCVDFSRQMLLMAEQKLSSLYPTVGISYCQADFNEFDFTQPYEAIVSSLALHHLADDERKQGFYHKIWQALTADGIHMNMENVMSSNQRLQELYIQKWHDFMALSYGEEEIQTKWLAGYYEDDRPISLSKHFAMMEAAGFCEVDVVCKYYNMALLFAKK